MAVSRVIGAGLMLDRGETEDAIVNLQGALTIVDAARMVPSGEALRCRLGQLLGGDHGAMLAARSRDALRAMGAVDAVSSCRLFAFGLEGP